MNELDLHHQHREISVIIVRKESKSEKDTCIVILLRRFKNSQNSRLLVESMLT